MDYDWLPFANCREVPTEIFFSDVAGSAGHQKRAIKVLCEPCPVRKQCLAAALWEERGMQKNNRFGVRGGLMALERHKLWKGLLSRRTVRRCARDLHTLEPDSQECAGCKQETRERKREWYRKQRLMSS